MKELVNRLNEARKAYYEGESIMSDKEYDNLYDKLVKMELTTGVVLPNSPTEEVGYTVVSNLEKVKHEQKALSLDKTKDVHFLETWLGTQDGVLSWKMDGMTVVATYENGQLIMAATRGNGEIGENVTHNARCIKGLPMKIRETGKVIVRGECILSYNDFEKIKESENGEYKNPRNLANASLRLYDSKKASTRHLQFKAFTLVECPKMPKTVEESFHWMEKQGFTVVEYKKVTAFTIKETITDYFEKEVESYTFPTDGLVLCMDDIAYGASLGVTNKFPRNSIAFKWQDDSVETTLTDVIWSPSRTGLINPVALFKPVEIEGTMVTKASLHNLSYLSLLQLVGEQFDFLRNILLKVHKSDSTMHGQFNQDASYVYQRLLELDENNMESFVETSKEIAKALFNVVIEGEDIPPADFVCASFQESGTIYLALLKLNYRSSYTQKISKDQGGTATEIIENTSLLPSSSTKPSEAAIINLTDMTIRLIEKRYNINGEKKNYFSEMFLGCNITKSTKRKLEILTRTIRNIYKNSDKTDMKSQMDANALLLKKYEDNKEIDIDAMGEELFGSSPDKKAAFDEKMENYDMQCDKIKIENESTVKKLEKQIIVTGSGIEISIPMIVYNRADIEIKQNSYGEDEIIIHNVDSMSLKNLRFL